MHLIVGGDSVIGKALGNYWEKNNIDYHSSTRNLGLSSKTRPLIDLENLDLANLDYFYDAVILCAAVSKLDECEKHPNRARSINVVNTFKLAKQLSKSGAFVLFLSTNQVFDGDTPFRKINDKKNPINEYGNQKSETEDLIAGLENYSILRLTKVIHPKLPLFKQWYDDLNNGTEIKAFIDMTLSPIDINIVVSKIDDLVRKRINGIYHCSCDVDISYYDYAVDFAQQYGFSKNLVQKDSCKNNSISFAVPNYTSLASL